MVTYFHKRYRTGVHVLTMDEGCSHWCLEKRILASVNSGIIYFLKYKTIVQKPLYLISKEKYTELNVFFHTCKKKFNYHVYQQ